MAKQIVTIGNKVAAHGEDCFLSMGGTVICKNTGRTFVNATVTACSCDIPPDIDSVGYEYHAGAFVPDGCLPYNTFYNGGLLVPARIVHGTYKGTGNCGSSNPNILSFDFTPILLIVTTNDTNGAYAEKAGESRMVLVKGITEQCVYSKLGTNGSAQWINRYIDWSGNAVKWYTPSVGNTGVGFSIQWNASGVEYKYVAIG